MVARATGAGAKGEVVASSEPGAPFASIRGPIDAGLITVNPRAAIEVPPNTWAFVIGHEFAHQVHRFGHREATNSELEFKADVIGAEYAIKAGFDLAAHVAWVLSRPANLSVSHGSNHDRALRLAGHFGVPPEEVRRHLDGYRYARR